MLGLFALALVGAVLFVLVEGRADEPVLDLKLFQDKTFALGNAAVFIIGMGFLSAFTFLPLFLVNVVGLPATRSGLTLMPMTLGVVAGNVLSGQIVSRLGRYKVLMLASLVLLSVSFTVMGFTLSPDSTQATVTAKMVLMGMGMGPSLPLYTLAIQNAVQPRQIGVATATTTFFRQLGSTVGVAVAGVVFASTLSSQLQERQEQVGRLEHAAKEAFTMATASVYRLAIGVAVLALLLTVLLPERPLQRGPSPASPPPME